MQRVYKKVRSKKIKLWQVERNGQERSFLTVLLYIKSSLLLIYDLIFNSSIIRNADSGIAVYNDSSVWFIWYVSSQKVLFVSSINQLKCVFLLSYNIPKCSISLNDSLITIRQKTILHNLFSICPYRLK